MQADQNKPKKTGQPSLKLLLPDEQEVILHISLSDIEPLIWRRLQLSDAVNLAELHLAIQAVFGWTDSHLHSFIIKQGESYSSKKSVFDANPDETEGDSQHIYLRDIIQRQIKGFRYIYDMGDNWMHKIRIEQVKAKTSALTTPICMDGERRTPPEDCGGSLGYEELLEALNNPQHPEHEQMKKNGNRNFNPEQFSLRQINQRLKKTMNGKRD